eukprot:1177163-Prorocentrum_minimum.AAC.2
MPRADAHHTSPPQLGFRGRQVFNYLLPTGLRGRRDCVTRIYCAVTYESRNLVCTQKPVGKRQWNSCVFNIGSIVVT